MTLLLDRPLLMMQVQTQEQLLVVRSLGTMEQLSVTHPVPALNSCSFFYPFKLSVIKAIISQIMTNLCKEACDELHARGFQKDIDPRSLTESFNLFKQADGQWFKSTKPSLHEPAVLTLLDLQDMPALKTLTAHLDELDDELKEEGGRVFIREFLAYKIKKGTQTPLLVYNNTEKLDGQYRKLCDEIIENGLERDRYRTEETYMLTKTAGNEWSITTTHENHSATKVVLDLKKMPLLKTYIQVK
jgi:hypothetical protein